MVLKHPVGIFAISGVSREAKIPALCRKDVSVVGEEFRHVEYT